MKSTLDKLCDKAYSIDLEDFTKEELDTLDTAKVVVALDTFLTGWGPSTDYKTYQAVICFTNKLFYSICDGMSEDTHLKRVCRYYKFEDFLKSQRTRALICVKNGRNCTGWIKE